MATNKYTLEIEQKATFIVVYRGGKFLRLELKKGKLIGFKWDHLMSVVPLDEPDIAAISKTLKNSLFTKIEEQKSLYARMMDDYICFYEKKAGIAPRINAIGGKAMKDIIAYFRKIESNDEAILANFQYILVHWNELSAFYQEQMELRQINSNLTTIIRQLKNGKSSDKGQQSNTFADDLRESI